MNRDMTADIVQDTQTDGMMNTTPITNKFCPDWAHWICPGCPCLCHYGRQRIEESKARLEIHNASKK